MTTTVPDPAPDWLMELAAILRRGEVNSPRLTLLASLDEIESWRRHARADGWQRTETRRSLAREFTSSIVGMGPLLRAALAPELEAYRTELTGRFTEGRVTARDFLGMDGASLRTTMASTPAIRAVWHDLVNSVKSDDDEQIGWAINFLSASLTEVQVRSVLRQVAIR